MPIRGARGCVVSVQSGEGCSRSNQWILRAGPVDLDVTAADKRFTIEKDSSNIVFLERQTQLLK